MFEPKRYSGVKCHNTEEWCKIWRGTYLFFEKCHEGVVEFWQTLESLKIFTLIGSFRPKYIMFELKSTEGLCVITPMTEANFERKKTFSFINYMANLVNFTREPKNLKIFTLRDFSFKVYNVELKKLQRSYTEGWCNI